MNRTANTKGTDWPSSDDLCRRLRGQAGHAHLHSLLERIQRQQDLAYDCLRRARWGEETEETKVRVVCPRCGHRAWNHSSSRGGKHRWRCVTKQMYARHQRTKGYASQGSSQQGCGFRFTDTTGTPFDQRSLPLGFVFLALYLPPAEWDLMMASLGDAVTSANLRTVLRTLRQQKHAQLLKGMKRYATRFCGEIILMPPGSYRMSTTRAPKSKHYPPDPQLPQPNPPGKQTIASDLSRLCATMHSLLDRVTRQAETLQACLMHVQGRPGLRHTLLTEATVTSRTAASRRKRGHLDEDPPVSFESRQEKRHPSTL